MYTDEIGNVRIASARAEKFPKPFSSQSSSQLTPGYHIRYVALGKIYGSRLWTVVFTVRANRIHVISARPMSRDERKVYEKEN